MSAHDCAICDGEGRVLEFGRGLVDCWTCEGSGMNDVVRDACLALERLMDTLANGGSLKDQLVASNVDQVIQKLRGVSR